MEIETDAQQWDVAGRINKYKSDKATQACITIDKLIYIEKILNLIRLLILLYIMSCKDFITRYINCMQPYLFYLLLVNL